MDIKTRKPSIAGWIVQHIQRVLSASDCYGNLQKFIDADFWEAYPVRDPMFPAVLPTFVDPYGIDEQSNPVGSYNIRGYYVFVINFRPRARDGWIFKGQRGYIESAGDLPIITKKPPWYRESGGVWRVLKFDWYCCSCLYDCVIYRADSSSSI